YLPCPGCPGCPLLAFPLLSALSVQAAQAASAMTLGQSRELASVHGVDALGQRRPSGATSALHPNDCASPCRVQHEQVLVQGISLATPGAASSSSDHLDTHYGDSRLSDPCVCRSQQSC